MTTKTETKPELTELLVSAAQIPAPQFSAEQLDYLQRMLTPGCCHCSGMHDPEHFIKHPEKLCELQKSEAWERAVALLGLSIERAVPKQDCWRCINHNEGRAEAEPPLHLIGDRVEVRRREHPKEWHPATLSHRYWGHKDAANQWLYEADYDDGNTSYSRSIKEEHIRAVQLGGADNSPLATDHCEPEASHAS